MKGDNKKSDACEIHGATQKAANRTLLALALASVLIVVWHVWVYGPTDQGIKSELSQKPFLTLLGSELWDVIFSRRGILEELKDVFPYFLAGILLAGIIRTYKLAVKMRNSLNRYGLLSVFLASLVGILTPLCACGTLTTAVSLLFAGVPLAPVMSLLVTSPLLSPSAYLLTLNDLGTEWTVIRTIAALSMGIFAGTITYALRNKGFQTDTILIEGAIPRGDFHDDAYPDERLKCNCKEKFGNRVAARTKNTFIVFLAKSADMVWLVGKYVLVGVAIGSIVERYMPYEWLYNLFGKKDPLSVVWITLGSVPLFLHQISASSILYHIKSSLNGTLDGGAALAFLIGGPVTAIPTMTMFWTMFRKRAFFLYVFVCIAGTIIIAYAFQWFVFTPYVDVGNPLLKGVRSISGGVSPIINKQDRHVRIVMDPGGKGIIAVYHNYREGKGNIVFDAGFERFLDSSDGRCDNRKYIRNIAEWLGESGNPARGRSILVYNTFSRSGLDKSALNKMALEELEKGGGIKIRLTDRRETPEISERLLNGYSQLWIFFGESGRGSSFSNAELEAISGFTERGNGMLIVAGGAGANRLSSRFGVVFSGYVENREVLPISAATYYFDKISGTLGKVLKFTHKA